MFPRDSTSKIYSPPPPSALQMYHHIYTQKKETNIPIETPLKIKKSGKKGKKSEISFLSSLFAFCRPFGVIILLSFGGLVSLQVEYALLWSGLRRRVVGRRWR